ncbi:hypothetical protein [Natronobacterium gregoryi]|uniref:Uncharacterized protein n=2 Tax=Natronobacterium gregoryi TaxID=44930 RepID=L0AJ01_NATGS|nr:hypothetical protein [Natronobacterium gregoryi]AFZ73040.1 hypothetical protein Natgr_1855 [Natronobacterium gregoryi SP2]ELY70854.1 hypothetical protein C490_06172 [Natronobacterium gregoryi SP2]PLK20435.1 hypothetical protein CYV19_09920 [Natronobacterium gregoryi SP2]SFI62968.1 hypothetical protein SAMN05443661_102226 [Natronobacterium gregoryi]
MISGFENDEAVFYVEREVATEEDPYGETEPVTEWVPLSLDDDQWEYADGELVYDDSDVEPAQVRVERQSAEYVREVYGEWPAKVYRVFAYPRDVGSVDGRDYDLEIEADDRVELASTDGRFATQPPTVQRLDASIPEYIQLEVTRIGL